MSPLRWFAVMASAKRVLMNMYWLNEALSYNRYVFGASRIAIVETGLEGE